MEMSPSDLEDDEDKKMKKTKNKKYSKMYKPEKALSHAVAAYGNTVFVIPLSSRDHPPLSPLLLFFFFWLNFFFFIPLHTTTTSISTTISLVIQQIFQRKEQPQISRL